MARRRRKKKGGSFPIWAIFLVAALVLAYPLYRVVSGGAGGGQGSFSRVPELNASDYVENSQSLRGNTYQLTGRIVERLDEWPSSSGRLYWVETDDGNQVGVRVPAEHASVNIERDQRFAFEVTVDEQGTLVVNQLRKA